MRLSLLVGEARREGRRPRRARDLLSGLRRKLPLQHEARLPAAHQLQIDFRQKLAVEQRAMLRAT